ncbi:hypothetical protein PM082_008761 [Marasmius tenuissimus]|nr:hypothetical protein PM082_008761 [Marasmius tenuissimus]
MRRTRRFRPHILEPPNPRAHSLDQCVWRYSSDSTSSARAKVVFGVDGPEEKVWGMQGDGDGEIEDEDVVAEDAESSGEEEPPDFDADEDVDDEEDGCQSVPQANSEQGPHGHSSQPRNLSK